MNVLIIGGYDNIAVKEVNFIARVGDKIDIFYKPPPVVKSVLVYPAEETLKEMNITFPVDAIITVG